MCSLYKFVSCVSVSASVGNMVLISVDRYVAICYPLHYPTRVTVRKVNLCIFLCWLCSGLYNSLYVTNDPFQKYIPCYGQCVLVVNYILGTADVFISFIIPVTLIILLYMKVFVVAVSQARAMRSHITAVTLQCSVTLTTKKSELKAARSLGILVVVFLTCFFPYYCVTLAEEILVNSSSVVFVVSVFSFNSFLNPVMYALFYSWFRKAVKLIVTLQILQPGSCEANVQ
uniref:G-protein coupled receptors family 1 profile domain-containing protein n=1 Tax=Monopterus albus TaxID=43700 RepID=A0A3Q3IXC3_MONAL